MDSLVITLAVASSLALVTNQLIDGLAEPVRQRKPDLSLWWLVYISWIVGGLLAYMAQINLFSELVPGFDPLTGRILTALVTGGGSRLLHKIFGKSGQQITATSSGAPGLITATVRTEPSETKE